MVRFVLRLRTALRPQRQALAEFGAESERYMQATPAFVPKLASGARGRASEIP
jgi:hypothetical protein